MAVPSPVTPVEFCESVPETTGSICSKLNALWSITNKICTFFTWFLNTDGTLSDTGAVFLSRASVPTGSMIHWPMDVAPDGWVVANGATVSRTGTYANLFAVYGVKYGAGDGSTTFGLPDCQRRVMFGASGTNVAGATGGAETVTLLEANLPGIVPSLLTGVDKLVAQTIATGTNTLAGPGANISKLDSVEVFEPLGDDEPFSVLNPYFSAHVIIKL